MTFRGIFTNNGLTAITAFATLAALVVTIVGWFVVDRLTGRREKKSALQESSRDTPKSVLPAKQHYFTGRSKALATIHASLNKADHVLLGGVGGIGKSTLVRQYVATQKHSYQLVLFVNYSTQSLQESLLECLEFNHRQSRPKAKYAELVAAMQNIAAEDCLLVIDNFDPKGKNTTRECEALDQLISQLGEWKILVATRLSKQAFAFGSLTSISLEGLAWKTAQLLFAKHWKDTESDIEAKAFLASLPKSYRGKNGKLATLLMNIGFHPLTLEIMAKTLHAEGREIFDRLLAFSSETEVKAAYHDNNTLAMNTLLAKIFSLSNISKLQVRLLQTLTAISDAPLAQEWVEELTVWGNVNTNRQKIREAFAQLAERGWVRLETAEGGDYNTVSCHEIVRLFVVKESPSFDKHCKKLEKVLCVILEAASVNLRDKNAWISFTRTLMSHSPVTNSELERLCTLWSVKVQKWQRYRDLAEQARDRQDRLKAIHYYTLAIEQDPMDKRTYYARGRAETDIDDDKSISDYTKAIELDPNYDGPYAARGIVAAKLKHFDNAQDDIDTAFRIDPYSPFNYVAQAFLDLMQGSYEKAHKGLLRAAELDPTIRYDKYIGYFELLGHILMNQDFYLSASEAFEAAIRYYPHRASFYYANMGRAYFELRDYTKAVWAFEKAAELGENSASTYFLRGHAKMGSGAYAHTDYKADIQKGYILDPSLHCACHSWMRSDGIDSLPQQ